MLKKEMSMTITMCSNYSKPRRFFSVCFCAFESAEAWLLIRKTIEIKKRLFLFDLLWKLSDA